MVLKFVLLDKELGCFHREIDQKSGMFGDKECLMTVGMARPRSMMNRNWVDTVRYTHMLDIVAVEVLSFLDNRRSSFSCDEGN